MKKLFKVLGGILVAIFLLSFLFADAEVTTEDTPAEPVEEVESSTDESGVEALEMEALEFGFGGTIDDPEAKKQVCEFWFKEPELSIKAFHNGQEENLEPGDPRIRTKTFRKFMNRECA